MFNEWIRICVTGLAGLLAYFAQRSVSRLDAELSKIEARQKNTDDLIYEHGCAIERLEERTKKL